MRGPNASLWHGSLTLVDGRWTPVKRGAEIKPWSAFAQAQMLAGEFEGQGVLIGLLRLHRTSHQIFTAGTGVVPLEQFKIQQQIVPTG